MAKWCDRCPQEINSCEECKGKKITKPEIIQKTTREQTREQKKRLKNKAKLIKK